MGEDYIPDNIEWAWFWCYNLAAVFMLLLCILHSSKVYQDLHTKERKCLNHRKSKPKLTKQYKFVQYLTLTVLFLHLCDSSLFGLEMSSHYNYWTLQDCRNLNNAGGWFLLIGKGCMYMLFMYRLDIAYGRSVYGYNKKFLLTIGWFNVLFGLACEAITTYLTVHYWSFFQDVDEFPNPCGPINDSMLVGFFPITMQVWDAVMNVLSLTLFMYPLWKAFGVNKDIRVNKNMSGVMIYIALKYSILTFIAFITTLFFWLLVHVAPNEYYLVGFDVVINSICIMLMTAYYPDNKYYEKMCCCFLLCCKSILKQNKSNHGVDRSVVVEVQTKSKSQIDSTTQNDTSTNQTVHANQAPDDMIRQISVQSTSVVQ